MRASRLFVVLVAAVPLRAQEPALSLERAIAMAAEHSPLRAIAGGRRRVDEGRARFDGAFPNPTFEWRRENLNSALQPDIFGTLQVPLDLTGRRFALRSAVSAAVQRGRADSTAAWRQLEHDVARAFLRASLAQELLAVAREERAARAALADFDAKRLQEGAVAEVISMRTRLESDRARMVEATAHGEFDRARSDLARAIGIAVESLPPLASVPLSERLPAAPEAATAMQRALRDRPDLTALRHAADESALRLTGERRGVVSDLQFVAGYKQTSGANTGVVGVIVPLPTFNRNEGARERAAGESMIASAEYRDAEHRVRGEVTAALRAYEAIRGAIGEGASGVDDRAAEIARIAEASYREGAISLVEVVEAQRARAETRAAAARWAIDARLAMLDINRATGAPILATLEAP